jgi:pimeloyl-ACP methyl ester carboxylesterase
MHRTARIVGVLIVALLLIAVIAYVARNPEKKSLDSTARATATGKFIPLSDGITEYELAGPVDGQTVVLCSGFSVPYYLWDSTAAALVANGFRVLRYNYYGRGFSDRPALRYDLASYNRQVAELLDTLHVRQPVDIAGISMGGAIAASFANDFPARVRSVTLVDPAIGTSSGARFPLGTPVVGEYVMTTFAAPSMAKGQLGDFLHPERYPDWVSRYAVQMQYKGFLHSLLATQRSDVFTRPATSFTTLAHSNTPILLVWGREDHTVPFTRSDTIRAAFPRAQLVAIDSAGHLPQIEQAAQFDSALVRFLRPKPEGVVIPRSAATRDLLL